MHSNRVKLSEAKSFHGHLGPYLVLGILAGELALKRLGCKKYFDLDVKVRGANKKPKSCLIDGLQLSTGATYGKGNIEKLNGSKIQISFLNFKNNKKIKLYLKAGLIKRLNNSRSHKESERFAKDLYKINPLKIFDLTTNY